MNVYIIVGRTLIKWYKQLDPKILEWDIKRLKYDLN